MDEQGSQSVRSYYASKDGYMRAKKATSRYGYVGRVDASFEADDIYHEAILRALERGDAVARSPLAVVCAGAARVACDEYRRALKFREARTSLASARTDEDNGATPQSAVDARHDVTIAGKKLSGVLRTTVEEYLKNHGVIPSDPTYRKRWSRALREMRKSLT